MKTDHRIDELRSFMNEEGIAAAVVIGQSVLFKQFQSVNVFPTDYCAAGRT